MSGCNSVASATRCRNGGACVLVDEAEVCNCTAAFAGERCERDVSAKRPCQDWKCHNGGVCHLVSHTCQGASIYDIRKIFGLFDPLPTFGADLYNKIHATSLTMSDFL